MVFRGRILVGAGLMHRGDTNIIESSFQSRLCEFDSGFKLFDGPVKVGSYSNWKELLICLRVPYVGHNFEAKTTGNNVQICMIPKGKAVADFSGKNAPAVATSQRSLADLCQVQGDYAKAEPRYLVYCKAKFSGINCTTRFLTNDGSNLIIYF
jgi:hypothetical protein